MSDNDLVTILSEWAHVEGICDGDPDACIGAACDKAVIEIRRLRELLSEIWRHRNGGSALSSSWDRRVTEVLETNGPA